MNNYSYIASIATLMQRATINRSLVTIIGMLLAVQSTIDVSYVAFVETINNDSIDKQFSTKYVDCCFAMQVCVMVCVTDKLPM